MKNIEHLDGNHALFLGLLRENKDLIEQWNMFERSLEKDSNWEELNQHEQNIVNWYKSQQRWYPWRPKNKRKFIYRNQRDHAIIQEIENCEYTGLKKALEIMLKDILAAHIRKSVWESAQVFLASEYDDIKSWIDAIIKIDNWNDPSYLGVDFCVTTNQKYINEKKEVEYTNPHEFSHHIWEDITMKRIIKDFNPQVISIVFNYYIKCISQWKDISGSIDSVYELAKKHIQNVSQKHVWSTQNSLKTVVEELLAA